MGNHLWHTCSSTRGRGQRKCFASLAASSDSLWPHGVQHARPPCPSPTPRVYSNSWPWSRWCHPTTNPLWAASPPTFNPSQHQGLLKWVSSSHQVAKVLEFQLQHQSFQYIFRTEIPGVTGKFGFGVKNEAGQRLTEFCQENALVIAEHPLPTTQENTIHMDITRWSIPKSEWLYSLQPKKKMLYTVIKNKTVSWLWLRSWTPCCQIQT